MNINNIAKIADSFTPSECNKAALYDVMQQALDNDGQLDEKSLAKMYRFFAPTIPVKPKTVEQWIAHAVPKNDVRHYLNYIYSDGKRLVATDGHRLHMVKKSYPAGFYNKNMVLLHGDDFEKYPDVDRLMGGERPKQINFSDLKVSDFNGLPVCAFDGVTVNAKYLKTACQYFDNPVITYAKPNDSVIITDGDITAIIMPLRT